MKVGFLFKQQKKYKLLCLQIEVKFDDILNKNFDTKSQIWFPEIKKC